ncbi:hypothetical protein ACFVDT_07050 [Streptomyces sp. NPDC057699]|uniref:hypothetical protein n=1 Tax=Streptomyces sp. NPDC057699 TaxID=3346220 RepID=UPI0036D1A03C
MAKKPAPSSAPDRQPNSIVATPATVAACRDDYAKGAAARAAMAKQAARTRR